MTYEVLNPCISRVFEIWRSPRVPGSLLGISNVNGDLARTVLEVSVWVNDCILKKTVVGVSLFIHVTDAH